MNKRILSVLIIFCTVTFSYVMIQLSIKRYEHKVYINNNIDDNYTSNKTINQNKRKLEKQDINKYKNDKSSSKNKGIEENKEIIKENQKSIVKNNESNKKKLEQQENNNKVNDNNEVNDNMNTPRDEQVNVENSRSDLKVQEHKKKQPFFKVPTKDIRDNLTLRDKQKLILLARKLSPFDYSRIRMDLHCEDEEQGVRDAIILARQRLSHEDYQNIRNILEKFINIELIEKES
ncbi:hypothetical protein [Clostridium brassicae]|uniref:Uncharacterized protein n=1 Tax=Clostridium brassicae TaxID=2999072 RepID=A0ABT4D925_9CLOT|nr:hypothetical protein [Clostridium brassicae]MCY6958796.1 hypothetical protein [Clostridium brassicae]